MGRAKFLVLCVMAAAPVGAQTSPARPTEVVQEPEGEAVQPLPPLQTPQTQAGRVAGSSVGEVGQRQTRDQSPNAVPTARIANRLESRVENRISSRLDRNFDAQTNSTSPFKAAENQVRDPSRR